MPHPRPHPLGPLPLRLASALLLLGAAGCDHGAGDAGHEAHATDPHATAHEAPAGTSKTPGPPANVVQAEMRLLEAALLTAVRGVGAQDVREVEHALHRVHAATERTRAALAEGRYHPPKNGDALDQFRALDLAFHEQLEPLVEASHANDVARTAEALGGVLRSCTPCHAEFRR